MPWSQREFIFALINAFLPSFANSVSRFISDIKRSRSHIGAIASLFHTAGSEYPESILNTAVASEPIAFWHVRSPISVYILAVLSL